MDGTGYSGHLTRTDFGPYPPCSPAIANIDGAPTRLDDGARCDSGARVGDIALDF